MDFVNHRKKDTMRIVIVSILSFFFTGVIGQIDTLEIRYFSSGELSTIITINDGKMGVAKAFDRNGKLVYSAEISRLWGNTSVEFRHYENGAVRSAKYTSNADAGIQWYNKTTIFSEDGLIKDEIEDSYERMHQVLKPHMVRDPEQVTSPQYELLPQQPNKEVMECGPIYVNKVVFVNHSNDAIRIEVKHGQKVSVLSVSSGGNSEPIEYLSMGASSPVGMNVTFQVTAEKKRSRNQFMNLTKELVQENSHSIHEVHVFSTAVKK